METNLVIPLYDEYTYTLSFYLYLNIDIICWARKRQEIETWTEDHQGRHAYFGLYSSIASIHHNHSWVIFNDKQVIDPG